MKKFRFLKFAMAGMILCSGFALFACGDTPDTQTSYEKMDALVAEMKENTGSGKLFTSSDVYNLHSDYIISSFNLDEDQVYQALFAIPMNYISSHYSILKDIDAKKDITKEGNNAIDELKENINTMKWQYNQLNLQYQRLKSFPNTPQHEIIYQGELQEYRYQTTDIVGGAYKVAISLANVEEVVFNTYSGKINKENITATDTAEVRDYLSLYVGNDYYTLLLKNSKSSNLSDKVDLIKNVRNDFKDFVTGVCAQKNLKSLSAGETGGTTIAYNSKVDNLIEVNELLKKDREIMTTATNEFSFYDFNLSYTGDKFDIDEVKDLNNYEDIHVHAIEDYFNTTLKYYTSYIKSIIV